MMKDDSNNDDVRNVFKLLKDDNESQESDDSDNSFEYQEEYKQHRNKGLGCFPTAIISFILIFIFALSSGLIRISYNDDDNSQSDYENYYDSYYNDTYYEDEDEQEYEGEKKETITVKEKTIFKKKGVRIDLKGYDSESNTFRFFIKNNSDITIHLTVPVYSINGIMTEGNMFGMETVILPKKKANAKLEIESDFMEKNGIEKIKYMDILFNIGDIETIGDDFGSGTIRIKTSAYKKEKLSLPGNTIYSKKGVKVNYIDSKDGEYNFSLMENKMEYMLFSVDNITINDYATQDESLNLFRIPTFNNSIANFSIIPDEDFMVDNGIKKVKKIEFTLSIENGNDLFEGYSTEIIKINVD